MFVRCISCEMEMYLMLMRMSRFYYKKGYSYCSYKLYSRKQLQTFLTVIDASCTAHQYPQLETLNLLKSNTTVVQQLAVHLAGAHNKLGLL